MSQPKTNFPKPGQGLNRLILLGMVAVVVIPLTAYALQNERARWQVALAEKDWNEGRREEAIETMRRVVKKIPQNRAHLATLARWLAEYGSRAEAIKLSTALLKTQPKNRALAENHILVLQECGEHEQASRLIDQLYEEGKKADSESERISRLNRMAYMKALGKRELPQATVQINKAIEQWEREVSRTANLEMSIDDAIIIASLELAESTVDQWGAVWLSPSFSWTSVPQWVFWSQAELHLYYLERHLQQKLPAYLRAEKKLKRVAGTLISDALPLKGNTRQELVAVRQRYHREKESLALLLTYRAMLYQWLDRSELSKRNRAYVLDLGYQPEELFKRLPSTNICLVILAQGTAYLDTRAFVKHQRGDHLGAVHDLDICVWGIETLLTSRAADKEFSAVAIEIRQRVNETRESYHVLLDHRRKALREVNPTRAMSDWRKLRQLGIPADEELF